MQNKKITKKLEENQPMEIHVGLNSEIDLIKKLVPKASMKIQRVLEQLKSKDAEIGQWFQKNPDRIIQQQKDPEKTIKDLAAALKLEPLANIKPLDLTHYTFLPHPKVELAAVGIALLTNVWEYISTSQQNTQDFIKDPLNVIRKVASNINASKAETDSVISAFEKILGIYVLMPGPLTMFNRISNIQSTAITRYGGT
jgi:hypothetical protein